MSNSFLNTMAAAAKTLNTLLIRFVFQRCLLSRENIGNFWKILETEIKNC